MKTTPKRSLPRNKLLLLLLGCAVAAVAILLVLPREREPSYAGHSLSHWLVRIERHNVETDDYEALENVRHIGTNALPCLLKWLRFDVPLWKRKLRLLDDKLPWQIRRNSAFVRLYGVKEQQRLQLALTGFRVLGPEARPAIPELVQMTKELKHPRSFFNCADALGSIGKAALPELLNMLADSEQSKGFAAFLAIRSSNNGISGAAVRELVRRLADENEEVAKTAAASLAELKLEPELVVPALTNALQSPYPAVRAAAASALTHFSGPVQLPP
jgi:HEAT repeat protein